MSNKAGKILEKILKKRNDLHEVSGGGDFELVTSTPDVSKGGTSLALDVVYTYPTVTDQIVSRPSRPPGSILIPPNEMADNIESFIQMYGPVNQFNYMYDYNNDGFIDGTDLGIYLGQIDGQGGQSIVAGVEDFMQMYGPVNDYNYYYDYNGDGVVDGNDLGIYLSMAGGWQTGGPSTPSGEEDDVDSGGGADEEEGDGRPDIDPESGVGEEGEEEGGEEDVGLEFPTIEYAGNFIAAYGGLSYNMFTDPNFVNQLYSIYTLYAYWFGPEGVSIFSQYYGDPESLFGEDNLVDVSDWFDPFNPPPPYGEDPVMNQIANGDMTPQEAIDIMLEIISGGYVSDEYYLSIFDIDGDGVVSGADIRAIRDYYNI